MIIKLALRSTPNLMRNSRESTIIYFKRNLTTAAEARIKIRCTGLVELCFGFRLLAAWLAHVNLEVSTTRGRNFQMEISVFFYACATGIGQSVLQPYVISTNSWFNNQQTALRLASESLRPIGTPFMLRGHLATDCTRKWRQATQVATACLWHGHRH